MNGYSDKEGPPIRDGQTTIMYGCYECVGIFYDRLDSPIHTNNVPVHCSKCDAVVLLHPDEKRKEWRGICACFGTCKIRFEVGNDKD